MPVQRVHAHLARLLADVVEHARDLCLQRLLHVATGLQLQRAVLVLLDVGVRVAVALVDRLLLGAAELSRGCDVVDADGEALFADEACAELGQTVHACRGGLRAEVRGERGEEAGLVAVAEGALAQPAADELTVAEADISVRGTHLLPVLGVKLLRGLQVDKQPRLCVGPHQHADDLLPRPQLHRLDDGGRRHVDAVQRVANARHTQGKIGAREELVLAGDEEGGGEEVLRGGHQDLAVLGGCQVVHDAHQRQRLRARLLCLRHVQVHFVPIKVGIVGVADALVEAEGAPGHDARAVCHDGHAVQAGLAVEEHHVAISQVALHDVAHLELRRDALAVAILEEPLAAIGEQHKPGARVRGDAIHDALPQALDVVRGDALGVRERSGHLDGDAYLVDADVGVGGDDSSAAEVDALAAEVAAEAALLALQPLHKASERLAGGLVHQRQPRKVAVYVHRALNLQKIPVLHEVHDRQPLLQPLPQNVVHLDDLHQLHRHVVLVAARAGVHFHAGPDADGWHRKVRHDERLGAAAHAQQLLILRADLLKQRHHPDGVEVVHHLLLAQVGRDLVVVAQRVLKLLLV
mmetsp:Transcript_41853/g.107090  ORF Transcript_41853/g.107090 Transcript_41853/m.107090 type:complete len:579 (+) Transcript_41853:833-2569(+)